MTELPTQQDVQAALDALPAVAVVLFAAMAVIGLLLWLAGAALARAACTVSGLVLGGLAGWFLGAYLADQGAAIIPLTVGAAIAGALAAALLFRVWVALAGAVVLGLAVPLTTLVWQGHTPQPLPATLSIESPAGAASQKPDDAEQAGPLGPLANLLDQAQAEASAWAGDSWEALGASGRTIAMLGAAVGALGGLLLGLLAPHLSAALQSALAGSLMMYLGAVASFRALLGDSPAFLPDTPRGVVVVIGLITALGLAIQWTVFRKRADK